MKKKEFLRAFALFAFAAILFASWRIYRKGVLFDDSAFSGKVEAEVNEILSVHSVRDKDLRKTQRLERKKKFPVPVSWVETEREILLTTPSSLPQILANLKKASWPLRLDFSSRTVPAPPAVRTIVELRRGERIYQRILFLDTGITSEVSSAKKYFVAIVIDDIGGRPTDLERLDDFISLGIPLTYAVLPMEKLSKKTADKIKNTGGEVIIHQPMEPADLAHNDPGKSALLVRMDYLEIDRQMGLSFKSVPHAVGVSNHMGSRFTSDARAMHLFLQCLKHSKVAQVQADVFFFDSHTSPRTVGEKISKQFGVNYLRNDIFLDSADSAEGILQQTKSLRARAAKKGYATAIAHIQREHIVEGLRRAIPDLRKEGFEFVHLSRLARSGSRNP